MSCQTRECRHSSLSVAKKPSATILLVDDDPLIRGLGRELLEHLGYQVETAGSATEALEKYQRMGGADLVVLDYFLPDRNGDQVLKEVKALDARARVLVASGFFSTKETTRLKAEGALGLIHKPYRLTDLERRIQEVLAGRSGF
jgi:two-component system, cell cycle sensor histidine kinase and response regulator CckA